MAYVTNALKMLIMLEENGIMKISELAEKLNITDRMVRKYYQDIKTAGVDIRSKRGIDGGYWLEKDAVVLQEQNVIKEATKFLEKNNFEYIEEYKNITSKIKIKAIDIKQKET